jgi:hypothetical protein
MVHVSKSISAGLFLLASHCHVSAAFHLWSVTELYSSEDGSVQYVKLTNTAILEYQMGNHVITCLGPQGTNSFTFPANLPSTATANKNFLIGTSNLATIPGGVAPDYVFTNGVPFLFLGGTSAISVGIDGSFQPAAVYTNLPTDGTLSLSGLSNSLSATVNAPRNFNGQSNTIVPVRFSTAKANGTNFVMTFMTATGTNSTPGANYTVEFKDLLFDPTWSAVTNLVGDGTTKSVTNAIGSSPQRVYRIRAH